jgi:hypothetical protein
LSAAQAAPFPHLQASNARSSSQVGTAFCRFSSPPRSSQSGALPSGARRELVALRAPARAPRAL